jgi:transcriptional regulator with XRE-family HTH domain
MEIGSKIREARIKMGISQRRLAKQLGISNTYLSDIEVGRTLPSVNTLLKISKALDKDISIFLKE